MRTWVFDLDGTICTQEKMGTYQDALPNEDIIEKISVLHAFGNKIIIHTARGMNTYLGDVKMIEKMLRPMTEKWLKDNLVEYDELIFGKPAGDVYVDDKGMNVKDFV